MFTPGRSSHRSASPPPPSARSRAHLLDGWSAALLSLRDLLVVQLADRRSAVVKQARLLASPRSLLSLAEEFFGLR